MRVGKFDEVTKSRAQEKCGLDCDGYGMSSQRMPFTDSSFRVCTRSIK
jgi:hypothetical protein